MRFLQTLCVNDFRPLEGFAGLQEQVLEDGTERESREKGERAEDEDYGHQMSSTVNSGVVHREGAGGRGD